MEYSKYNEIKNEIDWAMLALYNEGDAAVLKRGDIVLLDEFEFHRAHLLSKDMYDRIVINFKKAKIKELSTAKTDLLKCFRLRDGSKINVIHFDEEDIGKYVDTAVRLRDALNDKKFEVLSDEQKEEFVNDYIVEELPAWSVDAEPYNGEINGGGIIR